MKAKKNTSAWRTDEERIRDAARKAFAVLGLPEPADLNEFLVLCDACIHRFSVEAMRFVALRDETAAILERNNRQKPAKGKATVH